MPSTVVKKTIDRESLEAELLRRLRAVPGCESVRSARVDTLKVPALSNWTVVDHDLGRPDNKTCVGKLAEIVSELQEKYRLGTS